jgi:excisionase family DNA binding protein
MSWDTVATKEFYFVDEVAEILRMDVRSLSRIIKSKRITVHQEKPGAKIRIRHRDLMAFVERMRVDVEPEKERAAKAAGGKG